MEIWSRFEIAKVARIAEMDRRCENGKSWRPHPLGAGRHYICASVVHD